MTNQFIRNAKCYGCGEAATVVCANCMNCTDCTGCRAGRCTNNIPLLYRGATFEKNPLRRGLGLEYELASYNIAGQRWLENLMNSRGVVLLRHRDGSVKPSESEWVTNGPLIGDEGLATMTQISNFLHTTQNCSANITCGFHVHVDACKATAAAVRRFLWLYLRLEAEIYLTLVAPERLRNTACLPLLRFIQNQRRHRDFRPNDLVSPDMKKLDKFLAFVLSLYQINIDDAYDFKLNANFWRGLRANQHGFGYERTNNPRYCGMNLHAWYRQGSIEWRMKEQTVKRAYDGGDDLVFWPLFCGHFTDIGLTASEEDLGKIQCLQDFVGFHLLPKPVEDWLATRLEWRMASAPPPLERWPRREDGNVNELRANELRGANRRLEDMLRQAIPRDPFAAPGVHPGARQRPEIEADLEEEYDDERDHEEHEDEE